MLTMMAWNVFPEGWRFILSDTPFRIALVVVIYLAFTFVQRFLVRHHFFRHVGLQLNLLFLLLLVLLWLGPQLDQVNNYLRDGANAAAVFLGVAIGLRMVDVIYFDRLARWRKKPQVPHIVRDIGRWLVTLIALFLILRIFFPGMNLNVLAASSLMVGYILGNASQETLGNLFAGLALNTERPFRIGDWVTVSGHTGMVVDTTWRATRLRTKADDYIVIPNSSICKESIINYSCPTGNHACNLSIGVSYDTPPNHAREVILDVLRETSGVSHLTAPSVFLTAYGDFSINFTIKFFITDYAQSEPIKSSVMDRLWYAFRREGISIPFPVRELRQKDQASDRQSEHQARQEALRQLMSGVELFHSLSPLEINQLVEGATLRLFASGEILFHQGDDGDSFYVIRSGQVAVSIKNTSGISRTAAHLSRGSFFGEMSLLTGEPRSATVTAETDVEVLCVSKQVFAGLLQANADLADKLANVLKKRMAEQSLVKAASSLSINAPENHFALVARIRRFFGLSK